MRHYEIVFLVHPEHSEQVPELTQQYKSIIESGNGKVHRLENWGLRPLAYPIKKSSSAHYVLMNIECTAEVRKEITDSFHFSNAILRNLILSREAATIEPSPVMQKMKKAKEAEKLKKAEEATKQAEKPKKTEEAVKPAVENAIATNENNDRKPESDDTTGENDAENTPAGKTHADSAEK